MKEIKIIPQDNIKTHQTQELTNIASLLKKDIYRPPSEFSPHGDILCPDDEWRHIIGHDTRIDNGVHISYGLNQNIIVDMKSDEVLQRLYPYAIDLMGGGAAKIRPTQPIYGSNTKIFALRRETSSKFFERKTQ